MSQNSMTIQKMLVKYKDQISAALPAHMTAEKMSRLALTAIRKNKKLAECSPVSLFGAIIQASQLGLPIGSLVHLVPYKREVTVIPDYRGLIDLAKRSNEVANIIAEIVYEGDLFEIEYGSSPKLRHIPNYHDGAMIGAYAVAYFKDKDVAPIFKYWQKLKIDKIRSRSPAKDSGPWVTDYDAMAMKTMVKQLCKFLPQNPELAEAIRLDNKAEAGEPQGLTIEGVFDEATEETIPEPRETTEVTDTKG